AGPCGPFSSQQFIDGGYAESTGLGTLVDLAGGGQAPSPSAEIDGWATLIRQHNAGAMAQLLARTSAGGGSGSRPPVLSAAPAEASAVFLVPMVVFLQNHFRSDVVPSTSRQTSELLVPMDGKAAGTAQAATDTLLQRLITLTAPDADCPPAGPAGAEAGADRAALCGSVSAALRQRVPYPVVVVSPDTQPSVTAPLGWVLSRISRQGLDATMAGQAQTTCAAMGGTPPHRQSPDCQAGYGRLADLLAVLRGGT
ncbi:MAG TPA: hypothetical protein VFP72_08755, partial [Kineosporiaceae bacterium]|nr:hypothetical protein [Kineosporiaceae bacterium]